MLCRSSPLSLYETLVRRPDVPRSTESVHSRILQIGRSTFLSLDLVLAGTESKKTCDNCPNIAPKRQPDSQRLRSKWLNGMHLQKCRRRGSNPHSRREHDFESCASASSATPATVRSAARFGQRVSLPCGTVSAMRTFAATRRLGPRLQEQFRWHWGDTGESGHIQREVPSVSGGRRDKNSR